MANLNPTFDAVLIFWVVLGLSESKQGWPTITCFESIRNYLCDYTN